MDKRREKKFLRTWEFNIYKLMDALADVVIANGGDVKSEPWEYTIIHWNDRNVTANTSHSTYLRFKTEDNFVIYLQYDENPFYPPMYQKGKVLPDGQYSLDHCLEEVNSPMFISDKDMYSDLFTEEDLKNCAEQIYHYLLRQPDTLIRYGYEEREVPNTYNDGTHMERIYQKRFGKWKNE